MISQDNSTRCLVMHSLYMQALAHETNRNKQSNTSITLSFSIGQTHKSNQMS